jgi:hypothetical protein
MTTSRYFVRMTASTDPVQDDGFKVLQARGRLQRAVTEELLK